MSPRLHGTHSNSSDLNRLLADLSLLDQSQVKLSQVDLSLVPASAQAATPDAPHAQQSFAERLGQWLNWTDAIALSAALGGAVSSAPAPAAQAAQSAQTAAAALQPVEKECLRVQQSLVAGFKREAALLAAVEIAADFAPLRRYYLQQQRAMETALGPLRAQVRAAVAQRTPALARLASLDAVMETALATRERAVLASVPTLLEDRHATLRKAQRAALAQLVVEADSAPGTSAEKAEEPADAVAPWLDGFRKDMHSVLLAELELRLQPVTALLDALRNEMTRSR